MVHANRPFQRQFSCYSTALYSTQQTEREELQYGGKGKPPGAPHPTPLWDHRD